MRRAVISLGSNLGDRAGAISAAIAEISRSAGVVERLSSLIETESWGFVSHPFMNQVAVVRTPLSPVKLLDTLQAIERILGRTEKSGVDEHGRPVYHDREIDLDILDYDGVRLESPRLTLPHPHIHDRDFILLLLKELNINL